MTLARPGRACLLQSQPQRLEPQILGQEHGEDAAQVVYRGGVQVGLRVIWGVPDVGEGHRDEVDHRDPWQERGEARSGRRLTQEPSPRPGETCLTPTQKMLCPGT